MKLVKLQLITLRAFCLSLIALIDVCLEEESHSTVEPVPVVGCEHKDMIRIPTMGGGEQQICRACGIPLSQNVPPEGV